MEPDSIPKLSRLGAYAIAIRDGSLLLTTKVKGPYEGLLDLPGGSIEFGESPEQTLKREFEEEVAMTFGSTALCANLSFEGAVNTETKQYAFHHIGLIYVVYDTNNIPDVIPQDPFQWYPIDDLKPASLTPFAQEALQIILSA